jgi:aspartate aminotransferase
MTGWRIGYVIANTELIEKIAKLNQMTISNVPVFIQEAALKALEIGKRIKQKIRQEYYERASLATDILSKSSLEFTEPCAPFYIFPRKRGLDSERFALNLLDNGVAVAPGTAFGDYREHFRISLTAPRGDLRMALNKIIEATK